MKVYSRQATKERHGFKTAHMVAKLVTPDASKDQRRKISTIKKPSLTKTPKKPSSGRAANDEEKQNSDEEEANCEVDTLECEALSQAAVESHDRITLDVVSKSIALAKVPMQARKNVVPEGKKVIQGMVVGLYVYGEKIGLTSATYKFPWLAKLLAKFGRQAHPDFCFTSVQVNINYASRPHVDRNNLGKSQIIGLGDYSGGSIWVHDDAGDVNMLLNEDIKQEALYRKGSLWKGVDVDIRNKWFEFNGNKLHCTRPYVGNRYSLVYYTCDRYAHTAPDVRMAMKQSGFDFSWGSAALVKMLQIKRQERKTLRDFFTKQAQAGRRFGGYLIPDDEIVYDLKNRKLLGSASHKRYESYKNSTTIGHARKSGALTIDFQYDFNWGYLQVVSLHAGNDNWDIEIFDPGCINPKKREPSCTDQKKVKLRAAELVESRAGFDVSKTVVDRLIALCPRLKAIPVEEIGSRKGPTANLPIKVLRSLLGWASTGALRCRKQDLELIRDTLATWGARKMAEIVTRKMGAA